MTLEPASNRRFADLPRRRDRPGPPTDPSTHVLQARRRAVKPFPDEQHSYFRVPMTAIPRSATGRRSPARGGPDRRHARDHDLVKVPVRTAAGFRARSTDLRVDQRQRVPAPSRWESPTHAPTTARVSAARRPQVIQLTVSDSGLSYIDDIVVHIFAPGDPRTIDIRIRVGGDDTRADQHDLERVRRPRECPTTSSATPTTPIEARSQWLRHPVRPGPADQGGLDDRRHEDPVRRRTGRLLRCPAM